MNEKYLIYQPNHGLGVELFILETACILGEELNRTVVIPLVPELETNIYEKGMDYYFEIPKTFPWISFQDFKKKSFSTHLFKINPYYRREYTNSLVRSLHPNWLDNIDHCSSFKTLDINIDKITTMDVNVPLYRKEINSIFNSEATVVAFNYINGLIYDDSILRQLKNPFDHHKSVPKRPSNRFMEIAKKVAININYSALHWRRNHNIIPMAEKFHKITLPDVNLYCKILSKLPYPIYIATDTPNFNLPADYGFTILDKIIAESLNEQAVIDMACCINASFFIGTKASTYSEYICYSRTVQDLGEHSSHLI